MDELWHCVAFENTGTLPAALLREVARSAYERASERGDDDAE